MKINYLIISTILILLLSCNNFKTNKEVKNIPADSLVINIDQYLDKMVVTEGIIKHVCGVDKKKMKLKTEEGNIIKIIHQDSLHYFDKSLNKKKIRVQGIVKETRIEKSYIDNVEKEKTLLCHIDHSPCKDSIWVKGKRKNGTADSLSKRDIDKLRNKMEETQKDYISVITILAEEYEIIN